MLIEIKSDMAYFSRWDNSNETCDVITPLAIRSIMESINWKPGITWYTKEINVANEIRKTIYKDKVALINVHYIVDVGFTINPKTYKKPAKAFAGQTARLIEERRFFREPYLGFKEFSVTITQYNKNFIPFDNALSGVHDFGNIPYEYRYFHDKKNLFLCRAVMINGRIDLNNPEITPAEIRKK